MVGEQKPNRTIRYKLCRLPYHCHNAFVSVMLGLVVLFDTRQKCESGSKKSHGLASFKKNLFFFSKPRRTFPVRGQRPAGHGFVERRHGKRRRRGPTKEMMQGYALKHIGSDVSPDLLGRRMHPQSWCAGVAGTAAGWNAVINRRRRGGAQRRRWRRTPQAGFEIDAVSAKASASALIALSADP